MASDISIFYSISPTQRGDRTPSSREIPRDSKRHSTADDPILSPLRYSQ
jgi:hypothetical protein